MHVFSLCTLVADQDRYCKKLKLNVKIHEKDKQGNEARLFSTQLNFDYI